MCAKVRDQNLNGKREREERREREMERNRENKSSGPVMSRAKPANSTDNKDPQT